MQLAASGPRPNGVSFFSGKRWMQACALLLFWLGSEATTAALGWPIPGSILGLGVLWLMLRQRWLPLSWVEHGADGLLDHLLLFFVPAMLALVNHPEFLSLLGVKVFAAVLIGTVVVMCGTACVVELGFRLDAARRDER